MTHRLVVEKGRSKGQALRLKPTGVWTVGREQSTSLRVADAQASRKHFQVEAKLGEFVLTDLQSSNGTFVNGARVEKRKLAPGDKIQLGDTLVYFLDEPTESSSDDGGGVRLADRKGELTGRELAGYRLGRLLGRGGMGTVYEAVQLSLERRVAFKVLARELTEDPALIERFVAEARAAGRLNHANIVAVFDVGQADGVHFYSMEFMPGGSVDDLLRAEGRLPLERAIPIVFDAARALEYAERHGIVHRDVKPANLMLAQDGVAKLCDLGLAVRGDAQATAGGSPHYLAPEQARGEALDGRADLYALGATWYQLLAGETPFTGASVRELVQKHLEAEPPPLAERAPDVPPEVAALVHKLLAKDPAARVPSARQLQADLAELARRYAVRDTVMLRIESVAPEVPPSEEVSSGEHLAAGAAAAAGEGGAPRAPFVWPRWATWAVTGVVSAACAGLAFTATSWFAAAARERATREARAELGEARALEEAGELERAAEAAVALAERLRARGVPEVAAEAEALAEGARARRRAAREEEARRRHAAAEALLLARGQGADDDPETRACLMQVAQGLDQLLKELGDTDGARAARATLQIVAGRLAEAERRDQERKAREDAARAAFLRARGAVEELLRGERPQRFQVAAELALEYRREHGEVERKGGDKLLEQVQAAAQRAVGDAVARARADQIARRWEPAREALRAYAGHLPAFPDLELRLEQELAAVDEAERAHEAAVAADREREDRSRVAQALERTRPQREALRLRDAAGELRASALQVQGGAARRQLELRARRLELAGGALARLVEHVRAGGRKVEAELPFPGGGRRRGVAVEVDGAGLVLTFQLTAQVLHDLRLWEAPWAELARLVECVGLDDAGQLALACLAYERGEAVDGARRLLALQARGALGPDVEAMLELAATE